MASCANTSVPDTRVAPSFKAPTVQACIYVGNIPMEISNWLPVRDFFSKFGGVKYVKLLTSRAAHSYSKFAFITFYDASSMERALVAAPEELILNGRQLKVEKEDRERAKKKEFVSNLNEKRVLSITKNEEKAKWHRSEEVITGTCYIDMLNDDCMMCILCHLTVQQRINIERVCKKWQQLSLDSWSDIKSLKLQTLLLPLERAPRANHMVKALRRVTPALTTLDLGDYPYLKATSDLTYMIKNVPYPSVTRLKLGDPSLVSFVPNILNNKLVGVMCEKLPNLKAIDLSCSKVKDFGILHLLNNLNAIEELNLKMTNIGGSCLRHCNTLRVLKISYLEEDYDVRLLKSIESMDGHLEELSISSLPDPDDDITIHCKSLKKLELVPECDERVFCPDDALLCLNLRGMPNLVEIVIDMPQYFLRNPLNMKNLAASCKKLKKLNIEGSSHTSTYDDDDTRYIDDYRSSLVEVIKITTLTYLNISYLRYDYRDGVDLVTRLKNLEELHMMGMTGRITRQDIVDLVSELPALRMLNISGALREAPKMRMSEFCDKLCSDDGRPRLELIIGGCPFILTNRNRWLYGRFIINETVTSQFLDDDSDYAYDGSYSDDSYSDDSYSNPFDMLGMNLGRALLHRVIMEGLGLQG